MITAFCSRWFFALMLLVLSPLPGAEVPEPSPAMAQILEDRLEGKYDVRVKGLRKLDWSRAAFEKKCAQTPMEVYRVPYPPNAADFFSYAIYRERSGDRFFVLRTGGFAGAFEVYAGPVW